MMISLLSIIPIRAEASEASEMVSQILFGEELEMLESADNWTKIRCLSDNYEGWADTKMISSFEQVEMPNVVFSFIAILECDGVQFPITMGARLPHLDDGKFTINDQTYTLKVGKVGLAELDIDQAVFLIKTLEKAPYLWGGRSPMGIDCSGLSQLFYRLQGVEIPRDASQQVKLGNDVFLQESQPGDLAFFEKDGRITHVGILLDNKTIIHASGWVRIDAIDANGIYIKVTGKYSHTLVGVKRIPQKM